MRKETIYKAISVLLLGLPLIALAAIEYPTAITRNIVFGIATIFGIIAAIIGVVSLALGLFKFSTSGGDPRGIEESKVSMIWGAVGILFGVVLMNFEAVCTALGITFVTGAPTP